MDHNSKVAIAALIIAAVLIIVAIGIVVYGVRAGVWESIKPDIKLPEIHLPSGTEPPGTPSTFSPMFSMPPAGTPQLTTPAIPQIRTTPTPRPSVTPVTPPPEIKYESVFFGSYEQGNGVAPVEWLVLEKDGESCLLISRYALDVLPYHGEKEAVTWEDCSLRAWLNKEFLNAAFNNEEQASILLSEVDNSVGNKIFETDGGSNTKDRVYLLSREELETYFPTEGERLCDATVKARSSALLGYSTWWLRSPGYKQTVAVYVSNRGVLMDGDVDRGYTAVRPVIRVTSGAFSG